MSADAQNMINVIQAHASANFRNTHLLWHDDYRRVAMKISTFFVSAAATVRATCQHYRSSGISSTLCLISNTDKTWNLCDVIKNLLYSLLCCGCDDTQAFHNFRICLRMSCLVWGRWMWVENELKFHLYRHHVHQTFSIDMSKYFEYTMMIDAGNSTRQRLTIRKWIFVDARTSWNFQKHSFSFYCGVVGVFHYDGEWKSGERKKLDNLLTHIVWTGSRKLLLFFSLVHNKLSAAGEYNEIHQHHVICQTFLPTIWVCG